MNEILKSEETAWIVGALLVAGSSLFAFAVVGWIGIGIIGLLGLYISSKFALHGGQAISDIGFGLGDASLYAKQLDEARKSENTLEWKRASTAAHAERSRILYLVNTAFYAMIGSGFGFFVLRQL